VTRLTLGSLALLLSCGAPATSEAQLPTTSRKPVWVLVVHGSGDTPARWATGLIESLAPRVASADQVEFLAYDWAEASKDKLAAAENGDHEGEAIARVLLAQPDLTHVHVIAHSAGAWVAHGIEEAFERRTQRPSLHLTFLDPFQGLGLNFNWGASRFGAKADFSDNYLDREDGVPGTELPLRAAHTWDVTNQAARGDAYPGKEGHWWPTKAYALIEPGFALSAEVTGHFDATALRARFPPGVTEAAQ
jgi:hypothetical protein